MDRQSHIVAMTTAVNTSQDSDRKVVDTVRDMLEDATLSADVAAIVQTVANDCFNPDICKDNKVMTRRWNTWKKTVTDQAKVLDGHMFDVKFGTKDGSRYVTVQSIDQAWIDQQETRKKEDDNRTKARKEEDKLAAQAAARLERGRMLEHDISAVLDDIERHIAGLYGDGEVRGIIAKLADRYKTIAEKKAAQAAAKKTGTNNS